MTTRQGLHAVLLCLSVRVDARHRCSVDRANGAARNQFRFQSATAHSQQVPQSADTTVPKLMHRNRVSLDCDWQRRPARSAFGFCFFSQADPELRARSTAPLSGSSSAVSAPRHLWARQLTSRVTWLLAAESGTPACPCHRGCGGQACPGIRRMPAGRRRSTSCTTGLGVGNVVEPDEVHGLQLALVGIPEPEHLAHKLRLLGLGTAKETARRTARFSR